MEIVLPIEKSSSEKASVRTLIKIRSLSFKRLFELSSINWAMNKVLGNWDSFLVTL